VRATVLTAARVVALAGPVALAFAAGGYHDTPRLVAAIVAWALVGVAALVAPSPLPRGRPARAAILGLALLTAWTALSLLWTPVAGAAYDDLQRDLLYLGALIAAAALLGGGPAARAVEPAVAGGALAAILYGLSERLLPGVFELERSQSAAGRLDQPLTYWNATGALAAIGLVLCARIAGDESRPAPLRVAAAAAAAPLGLGLYATFSRGALMACAAGLAALLVAAPTWAQVRGIAVALEAGALAALAASGFEGATALEGTAGERAADGAIVLALLAVVALAAATVHARVCRDERAGRLRTGRLGIPRRAARLAVAAVIALPAGFVAAAVADPPQTGPSGATASRLGSLGSNRYEYWRVAAGAFADHPLRGIGSGGFRVAWLRDRDIVESTHDVHSLYLEAAAELGIVGLALMALTLGAVAAAAREAHRRGPPLAAGAIAGLVAWAAHAGIDWDWEMPALTLPAILLAGTLLAASGDGAPDAA
jgi:hypothetical protein